MVKYNVLKLMLLLVTFGLAACGTKTIPASSRTPTPTSISTEAVTTEPPPTNALAQTVLPSPTSLADHTFVAIDDISFTRFSETAVNLDFSYPDEWLVENDNTGKEIAYLIASNDALLDGLDAGESGGVVRIAVGDTENWIEEQRGVLEGLVALYESVAPENIEIIQTPISFRINGLEAATTTFYINDESNFMSLTFIQSGEQSVTVVSEVSADKEDVYRPILEVITESIYVPEDFKAHQIATRPFPLLFRYPVSWSTRPVDDSRILVGPYEVVTTGELGDEAVHVIDWLDSGPMVHPLDFLAGMPDPITVIERGEVIEEAESLIINGQEAARIVYNGRFLDNDVILIYTVIAAEPYMVVSSGITAVDNPDISVPIHVAISDSIILQEELVDFASPESVVGAVFSAAQTENFGILPYLCDPSGEADEDVKDICSITPDHERRDEFVQSFATAEINGEIVIDGYSAYVPFVFGPNKEQNETMELIRRNQLWYLLGF